MPFSIIWQTRCDQFRLVRMNQHEQPLALPALALLLLFVKYTSSVIFYSNEKVKVVVGQLAIIVH